MADSSQAMDEPAGDATKRSKMPLIIGILLALAGGGGGYFATMNGLILGGESDHTAKPKTDENGSIPVDVAYVDMEPLTVSLRPPSTSKHLVFRASLEVMPTAQDDVRKLLPRVTDVLNSYLRALDPADFEDALALTRLRAQMLRRVQVVVGTGKVNDLLIMEFVLN